MSQEFNEWKIGDICYRKAEKCKITHIDFSTNPASVIIRRLSDGTEINTEFSKLTRPNNNQNSQQMKKKTDAEKQKKLALKHKLKQKIIYFRNIVTVGCGNERCTNPYCKSNIDNEDKKYSDSDASKLAVKMVKNKVKQCNEFPKRIIEENNVIVTAENMENIDEKKEEQIILEDSAANEALKYRRDIQNKQKEQNVTHKINGAVSVEDLVPYIKLLIPLKELQNILIEKYNKVNFSMGNVNKLYMKSSPIHEILFDELLVKIITFCDFRQYPSITVLNKQFKHIMKTHVSIYSKYTLHIVCSKSLWQKKSIQFVLNHKQKLLAIECKKKLLKQYSAFGYGKRKILKQHPMDIVKSINKNNIYKDLHNSFFDWSMLNKVLIDYYRIRQKPWNQTQQGINDPLTAIFGGVMGGAMGGMGGAIGPRVEFEDEKYENVQSEMMEIFLDKMYKHILSLTIRNIRNIKLFEKDLNLSKFPKLFHVRFDLNITKQTLLCYDLSNILSIELYDVLQMKENEEANMNNMFGFGGRMANNNNSRNVVKDSGDRNICDILDIIFKSCKHLLAFECVLVPKLPPMFPQQQPVNTVSSKRTVIFPETLEFLFLSQCDTWFNIDLTKCNNLVGLYLLGDNNSVNTTFNRDNIHKIDEFIKWPKEKIQCLILQQTIQNQINIVNNRRQQSSLLPAFINHFYKYFEGIKNKIESRYYNIPNIQFIKYITQPLLVDETDAVSNISQMITQTLQRGAFNQQQQMPNNAKSYNPINKNNNEIVTIEQMNQWTEAVDIEDIMSLQNQYLIIKNKSKNHSNVQMYENDLWEILLKLSSNNIYGTQMYKEWFERDISIWIKNMFKLRPMS